MAILKGCPRLSRRRLWTIYEVTAKLPIPSTRPDPESRVTEVISDFCLLGTRSRQKGQDGVRARPGLRIGRPAQQPSTM